MSEKISLDSSEIFYNFAFEKTKNNIQKREKTDIYK